MKKSVTAILIATLVSGCASSPDSMIAKTISPMPYQDYSCGQLETEYSTLVSRSEYLDKELRSLYGNDVAQATIGLIAFWPMLILLEGGDGPLADEYTTVKGKMNAIESASINKSCPALSIERKDEAATSKVLEPLTPECKNKVRRGMYQMACETAK